MRKSIIEELTPEGESELKALLERTKLWSIEIMPNDDSADNVRAVCGNVHLKIMSGLEIAKKIEEDIHTTDDIWKGDGSNRVPGSDIAFYTTEYLIPLRDHPQFKQLPPDRVTKGSIPLEVRSSDLQTQHIEIRARNDLMTAHIAYDEEQYEIAVILYGRAADNGIAEAVTYGMLCLLVAQAEEYQKEDYYQIFHDFVSTIHTISDPKEKKRLLLKALHIGRKKGFFPDKIEEELKKENASDKTWENYLTLLQNPEMYGQFQMAAAILWKLLSKEN